MPARILIAAFLGHAALAAASPADLRDFQQQAAEILEANDIPGAGIALVQDGEIAWAGGIGYADYAEDRPVLATTRFRTGSITKMFTALAVLELVEAGRLSLDTPVQAIAPEIPIDNPWHATDPVRVSHLLEHTAGFDDMHFRNINGTGELPDSLRAIVLDLDHELAVRWRPGVKHAYANPGYAIAGYLVEKVSGMPFHRYVNERVLAPLGMEHAAWGMPADNNLAQGYTMAFGDALREVAPRAIRLYPAGELSASSRDFAQALRLFIGRGEIDGRRLIREATMARMETPRTTRAARNGLDAGYAPGNYTIFREGFRLQGHSGGLDGFIAELAYSAEYGFGYVILLNRADAGALHVLGDLAVRHLARDIAPPAPASSGIARPPVEIAGCYRMSNPRNEILHGLEWLLQVTCASIDGERVLLRHPLLPRVVAFEAVGEGLLREVSSTWPTAVFMQDAGTDAIDWSGIYFERSSRFGVMPPLLLALASLALMLSSLVYLPVWLLRTKFGALKGRPALAARAWPVAASALFAFTILAATRLELSLLDSVNAVTLAIFAGGIAFVTASAVAACVVIRHWRARIHPVARWHSLLVALACVAVSLYLVYWRLVPLALWAW